MKHDDDRNEANQSPARALQCPQIGERALTFCRSQKTKLGLVTEVHKEQAPKKLQSISPFARKQKAENKKDQRDDADRGPGVFFDGGLDFLFGFDRLFADLAGKFGEFGLKVLDGLREVFGFTVGHVALLWLLIGVFEGNRKPMELDALLQQPEDRRDDQWERDFLALIPKAKVLVVEEQAKPGPDGWPYLLLRSGAGADQPFLQVLEWAATRGIGLALNTHKMLPDYVFTYGMLWNYAMNKRFVTEGPTPKPGNVTIAENEKHDCRRPKRRVSSRFRPPGFARIS